MSNKCDKCGVELTPEETPHWRHVHDPERCRDRLAAQLAEAERGTAAMASGYESQIAALRAELEATKARLAEAERYILGLQDALSHQTSVADAERGRADRAEAALAECGRAGCPTAAGHK